MTRRVNLFLTGLVVLTIAVAYSKSAMAQAPQKSESTAWVSSAEKQKVPLLAGGIEFLVPFVGYAYAGNLRRGVVPNVVRLGGLVIAAYSMGQVVDCLFCEDEDVGNAISGVLIGEVLYFAGSVWASAGAYNTADDFNRALRERVRVSVSGRNVQLGFAIPL